jgi:hypothetical protein
MASVGIISNYFEIPKTIIEIDSRGHHENFKTEWRKIVLDFDMIRDDALIDDGGKEKVKMAANDLINNLAELVYFNSSLVTVRTSTFGTSKKFYNHFMIHLSKEIFTKENISYVGNNIDNSLKLAKLLYIDDSIIRFLPELRIKPKDVHARELILIGAPAKLIDWVFDVEKFYARFLKKKPNKEKLLETLEYLYNEKINVVKTAIEIKMFLPISPKNIISDDINYLHGMIMKDWKRNRKVDSNVILNYLYFSEMENLKEIGLF